MALAHDEPDDGALWLSSMTRAEIESPHTPMSAFPKTILLIRSLRIAQAARHLVTLLLVLQHRNWLVSATCLYSTGELLDKLNTARTHSLEWQTETALRSLATNMAL